MMKKLLSVVFAAVMLLTMTVIVGAAAGSEPVAKVDGTEYGTPQDALNALTGNSTLTLLQNITIEGTWDCRNTGAKITANNVTIDGNGNKITFEGPVDDAGNHDAAFRVEGSGITFKDLTIEVTNSSDRLQNNRYHPWYSSP